MGNTVINTPELLNLDSTTGATVLAKGTVSERPPVQTFSVEYLAVAGGGGGGYQDAGGGGAGGFLTNTLSSINNGQSFTLTIGEGGAGGTKNPAVVNSGDNTVIAYDSTTITAIGGGGGSSDNNVVVAASGGSGGGGAGGSGTNTGGAGTTGQGNAGGNGASNNRGGGGGGAGAAGQNATSSGANGGIGLTTTIISTTNAATASVGEVSGSNLYFAGGGGGDNRTVFGSGGLGGGTNAAANPIDAAANTGGGGGSAYNGSPVRGGAGGSGVIILKYDSSVTLTKGSGLTEASGSPFTEGSYKVSVFTQGTGNVTLSTTPDTLDAINGTLRFNTDTNKTEYFDGSNWYEIVDEYASGFVGPATNYFETKLYKGNDGTQSIGGYINGAGSFNGSSSKIDLGNNSSNNTATLSVSLWFKTAGHSATAALINNGGSNSGETGYYLGLNSNGTIKFEAGTGTVNGAVNYADSNWHQIVLTLNSGAYNIYVDGNTTPVITGSGAFTTTATRPTWIGQFSYTSSNIEFFEGSIDQVRLYNTALSASDVAALNLETAATATTAAFPSGQTAVATYTMDTSANGILNTQDLSTVDYPTGTGCMALYEMNGNSNDTSGTYNGTPANITYQGGAFDQAAVFNGSSSKITFTNSAFNITTYSLSFWIYSSSYNQSTTSIINMGLDNTGSAWSGLAFGVNANKVFYYGGDVTGVGGSGFFTQTGTTNLTDGAWTHIAIVVNGTAITGYIDGTQDSGLSRTLGTNMTYRAGSINTIGVRQGAFGSYGWYNGSVDQFRVFNTALSASDITTLARGIATSYSGAATNVNFNGHLDFEPDFIWVKNRTGSFNHILVDSIRGANNLLFSDTTAAALTSNTTLLSSIDELGFTVGYDGTDVTNGASNDYVSWNWKAGGTAVTNNDGTIASQVSANKDSGFSIVKYTGNGGSTAKTIGHGLSSAPEIIINKDLDSNSYDWAVYTSATGNTKKLALNQSNAQDTSGVWNDTSPTNSVFSVRYDQANATGNDFIAYCWHSCAGYSKIGTYEGNSSTKKIELDFAPSWVMIKLYDVAGGDWYIYDNKRNPANPADLQLEANTNAVETDHGTAYELDFLSDGFELKGAGGAVNFSGRNYLYMAIA